MKSSLSTAPPYLIISLIVYIQFLWTGIYLITRNFQDRFSVLSGLSMLGVCWYILGSSLGELASSLAEANEYASTYWIAPIIPVLWMHAILELIGTQRKYDPIKKYSLAVLYSTAVILIFMAQSTNYITDYTTASWSADREPHYIIEPGMLYDFFILFLFSILAFTFYVIIKAAKRNWHLIDKNLKRYYVAIAASTALFGIGGTVAAMDFRNLSTWGRPESKDQWIILLGLLILITALTWYKLGREKNKDHSFILKIDFVIQSIMVYAIAAFAVSILYFSSLKPPEIVWTISAFILFYGSHEVVVSSASRFLEKRLMVNHVTDDAENNNLISDISDAEMTTKALDEKKAILDQPDSINYLNDPIVLKETLRNLGNIKIGKDFQQSAIFSSEFADLVDPDGDLNNTEKAKVLYDLLWRIVDELDPRICSPGAKCPLEGSTRYIDGEVWGPYACLLYLIYGGRRAAGEIGMIIVQMRATGKDSDQILRIERFLQLVKWHGREGRTNYRRAQVWENIALDAFCHKLVVLSEESSSK